MYKKVCKICRLCKKEGVELLFETAGGICAECVVRQVERQIEKELGDDYEEVTDVRKDV